jgi:hypothetical protein
VREEHFQRLLAQEAECDATPGYPLAIMFDLLMKNGFERAARQLEGAHRLLLLPFLPKPRKAFASYCKALHQSIQTPHVPQLTLLLPVGHTMGLNLVQAVPGYIDCEIFNSGGGLEFHKAHPANPGVVQTMLRVRMPLKSLTEAKLKELLVKDAFDVETTYRKILGLPGAVEIQQDFTSAVWQREQQGPNCTLMWIFAFLKNTMSSEDYNRVLYLVNRDPVDTTTDPKAKL